MAKKRKKTKKKKTTARKPARKKTGKRKVGKKKVKKKSASKGKKATKKKTRKSVKRKATKKKTAKKKVKKKPAKKKSRKKRKPNAAFMKSLTPSDHLAEVVGKSPLPRTEVTKKLWAYIKKNKLQDTKDRRNIRTGNDAKLKVIFRKDVVTMFEIPKLLSKHLS